ncbi:MFS transporter [Nonomuraea jabiensis]|uniref:MFS family permease n=1 Tax=Nonomuraea jabiensis TaxID=882448 RepID=A0A7W9FZN1_9ACTN|nr:MFS transporter [Nonomuraea jabiensis]MBB5774488.1 MFS family permease [Nonomuraea jabiensis]
MTARSALRRYMLVSFLTWLPLGLMVATMVLLMTARGLGLAEVGLSVTVFSVVTATLELPTGGLADVLGRRVVLAVSAAFTVAALALMAVSTTFWMFVAGGVLKGVARALSSGPATSWYVDTLHGIEGRAADLKPGLARGGAMESVALCVGVLAGGGLPLLVPPQVIFPLAAPPLVGAVAAAVLLVVVVFAMPEPEHVRRSPASVLREVPATVVSGIRLAAGAPVLRRMTAAAAASGVVLCSIELLTPGRLAELAGTAERGSLAYAVVSALGFASSAAGAALAPRVARLAGGSARGAIAGSVLAALSVGALAATAGLDGPAGLVSAGLAYMTLFVGLSVAGLLCLEMTHNAVSASERTTITSTSSLSLQAGGVTANLTLGALAGQAGVAVAWIGAALVVLASALLFVRMPGPTGSSRSPAPRARSHSG